MLDISPVFTSFLLIAGAISFLYVFIIALLTTGWLIIKSWKKTDAHPEVNISLIIAARNEAENIEGLLQDIVQQQYPSGLFEAIVVDDHSTDDTGEIVQTFGYRMQDTGCRMILVKNDGMGKKAAIRKGVEMASGDLIVTIDTDCRVGSEWLSSIASYYEKHKPKLISAPVVIGETNGFFKSFQSMELMSLVASGAGSIGIRRPIMCNGANLAFEKEAFWEANSNAKDLKYASGDDIFLLLKIKKLYGSRSIHFLKSPAAIVETRAKKSIREYFNQRFRWVSKSKGYRDPMIISVAIVVFLFNLLLITSSIFACQSLYLTRAVAALWFIKILIDLPILISFSIFAGKDKIMGYYFFFQVIYVPFAVITAIWGILSGRFRWKDRKIRN
ncbi:MAG: glycosyltransferase [Bacteroidota bacterium]|nr:glycosyltransferase [Bacteroidota bacterium]